MTVDIEKNGGEVKIRLSGKLDTKSAMKIDKEIKETLKGADSAVLDLAELTYVSSSGLRTILGIYKMMNGRMTIKNVRSNIMELFEITGFGSAMNIGNL